MGFEFDQFFGYFDWGFLLDLLLDGFVLGWVLFDFEFLRENRLLNNLLLLLNCRFFLSNLLALFFMLFVLAE
jgi:hypothetical protein